MKHIMGISLEEETIVKLREKLRENPIFRSKSHVVEYAINRFLGEK